MGKILYIRLDSSPLPETSDEVIVKDFNLESYFCTLLGKRLLAEQKINQSVPFPGKIISDFKDSSPKIYNTVIEQWENILVQLLVADNIRNQCIEINIPSPYFDWLSHHENPIYRKIGKNQSLSLSFKGELFYEELVMCILMKRLHFTLSKITDDIDYMVVSLPILNKDTTLIKYLMQLNDKFNGLNVIGRLNFIETYVASKKMSEKRVAFETKYELYPSREGRIRIRDKKTEKYGFINEQMELVIPCEYDFCGYFLDGLAFAYNKHKLAYQIDKSGNIQELPSYDYSEVFDFSDGLARVKKHKERNYTYINKEGKEIIHVFYPGGCGDFKEGLAAVVDYDGYYGFIDKTGTEVIQCQFNYAQNFSEGLAMVEINDKRGFIDKTGKMVIPCKYTNAENFSEGLAVVEINGKKGFIDKTGKIVIPCKYSTARSFSEGLAAVFKDDYEETYFIDKSGKVVFSTPRMAGNFSEGLVYTNNGVNIEYIDKQGKIVIPNAFYSNGYYFGDRGDFSNGLVLVRNELGNPHYFINKKGEIIIPPDKYRDMRAFHDGLACVDGGYIDNEGNEIIPTGIFYSQSRDFSEGMVWLTTLVKGKIRYALIKKEWLM